MDGDYFRTDDLDTPEGYRRIIERGRNEHREHVRSGERGEFCMYCVVLGLVVPDAW